MNFQESSKVLLGVVAAIGFLLFQQVARADESECPSARLLPELDKVYHRCQNGFSDGSCDRFVSLYQELVPDCRGRSNRDSTYPAINDADPGAYMDYLALLAELAASRNRKFANKKFGSARANAARLFASEEFANTLVGGPAEQYSDLIDKLRKRRQ